MSLGPIVVQKYGGSSVATAEKILAIAERVKAYLQTHPHIVVAVSAMGKTTDQLVALARQVSKNPHGRDYDLLLASGEQVAVATPVQLGRGLQEFDAFMESKGTYAESRK